MAEPGAEPAEAGAVHVVLASASPRRAMLLARLGIEPEVRPADVDESQRPGEVAADLVTRLARTKAEAIASGADAEALVIAADTVVVAPDSGGPGEVLGKPADEADAAAMLRCLSGTTHAVLTGVHVVRGERSAAAVERTEVRFRALAEDEIAAYVATGEPLDKAGGYGIQGAAGMFVEGIAGSDTNVVGLPLATVVRLAGEVGVRLLPR